MNIRNKIIFGFVIIVVLLSATGIFLIQSMQNLAKETENIYKHPFTVSNAARDINIHVAKIQNYLKDIVISKEGADLRIANAKIDEHETLIYVNFDLITRQFLGNIQDVQKARQEFSDWRDVYNGVISKKNNTNNIDEPNIINNINRNANRVNNSIQNLIDFATNKANEFYTKTLEGKREFLLIVTFLLITIITISILILMYVVRNHDITIREANRYFHLIDQNILMASLNKDGKAMHISNALCRYFGHTKKDIIGKKYDFFTDERNSNEQKELSNKIRSIVNTGSEWKGDVKRVSDNGEARWLNINVHPVLDEHFNISSFTYIIHDVTDKKALEELSVTDQLTSLHNRRYFDEVIDKEIKVSRRNKDFLTFAILDIDFFKKYNDHYGHPAGDEVLISISKVIKKILNRPNDYIFRLGGEEFGILFSNNDPDSSYGFLEKLRKSIESLEIRHDYSTVSSNITVSIGARVAEGFDIPEKNQFYIQADQSLYDAKQQRNKVIIV